MTPQEQPGGLDQSIDVEADGELTDAAIDTLAELLIDRAIEAQKTP